MRRRTIGQLYSRIAILLCRVVLLLGMLLTPLSLSAQGCVNPSSEYRDVATTLKLNVAYAALGVINPQVEFQISGNSWFQTEIVYSPWQSFKGHPLHFGIFQNEYRYYIPGTKGLYVGANVGAMAFHMSKPMFVDGSVVFQNRYCKGYGVMAGAVVGYKFKFEHHPRLVVDLFVGFGYMHSKYNGYSMSGEIDMYPHRPADKQPASPDPFNISAEWLPNKAGVSVGVIIFDRDR